MKTYSLSCKDMGMKCNYVATAESREEVMDMAHEHFAKAHPKEAKEAMEQMSKEELDQKMMENIVEKNGDGDEEPMEEDLM
jgi:predicted small metal-binding protein